MSTPVTEKRQGEPVRQREKGGATGGLGIAWRSDEKVELE